MAKILLGKGPTKETGFLDVTPIHLEVCFYCVKIEVSAFYAILLFLNSSNEIKNV